MKQTIDSEDQQIQELRKKIQDLEQKVRELEASKLLYHSIFENLPFGVQIFDHQGFSFNMNQSQQKLLGLPDINQGIGQFNVLTDTFSVNLGVNKIYERAYKGESVMHKFEYDLAIAADRWTTKRETVYLNENIFPVVDNEGKVVFVVSVSHDITTQKMAEAALISAKEKSETGEKQFRLLVENAPVPIFIQVDYKFAYLNKEALKLYGIDDAERLIGTPVLDRIHPDYIDVVKERIRLLNEKGISVSNIEYKHIDLNNRVIDVEVNAVPVVYQDKKGALVFLNDITRRKTFEKERQKNFELIHNLSAQVPGVIYQYQLWPDGRSAFPFSSQGMYDIYEVTSEEVREDASPVFTRIHPDDYDYIVESIMESARNQTMYSSEFRVILPKQGLRWRLCHAKPELMEDGSTLWHGIITDITEKKRIEDEFKQRSQEINNFFDCATDLLCIASTDGYFIRLNKEWEKVLGYSLEELKNRKFLDFVHPDDVNPTQNTMNQLSDQILIANFTNRYLCKNGEYKWIEWRSFPDGNRIYAAARDITKRKEMEDEIIRAKDKAEDSDRLKTAFLLNMSHEIKTPMNAINGFAEMLNRPDLPDDKRKSFTSIIINSSHQLQSVVENILTISSLETRQEKVLIEPVCINNIILDLFSIFKIQAQNQNILLYTRQKLSDKQSEIYTDRTKVYQILSNLLTNALKFTHEGYVEFGYSLKGEEFEFYVTDTGIGIKPEMQEKIFERFIQAETGLTRRYGGNGLGLSISKGFVELLGGKIWLESEFGKGTSIYFSIPYKPVFASETPDPITQESQKMPTIIVAEDEEYNFLYLEEILMDMKVKLLHAKDGLEAISLCESHPEADLILMDIKMPNMDGNTAAKKIRSFRSDIYIIAQSAYTFEQYFEKYRENPFDDFIPKPISIKDLKQKIGKFVEI